MRRLIVAAIFCVMQIGNPSWATELPALPQAIVDTTMPNITGTTYTASTCGDVQTHLNSAAVANTNLNHVINIDASLNCTGVWTLKSHAGPGWIILRSSAYASLPPVGTRVALSDLANMPSVTYASGANESAISVESGANYYRLIGIEVLQDSTCTGCVSAPTNYALIVTGYGANSYTNTGHIIIDRCVVHDTDAAHATFRGALLNAQNGHTAVIDSYFAGFKVVGGDSQAFYAGTNPGPILARNNFLEAAGENLMIGADDPGTGLTPVDITIQRNTMSKNSAWWMGATSWTQKCLLEFKGGSRVLVEGNTFENQAWDGQGFAFRFTVRNNSGGSPGQANDVSDLTFRYNLVRNVTNGFSMFGSDDQGANYLTLHSKRWYIHNNLIYGLGWNCGGGADCGDLFQFASGGTTCVDTTPTCKNQDVTIAHNTVDDVAAFVVRSLIGGLINFDFKDNLINANSSYGVFANFGGNSWATTALGNIWAATYSWVYNQIAAIGNGDSSANYPQGTNAYPASVATIQWTNRTTRDYTLAVGSPAIAAASDGTDQGVNFTAYNAARNATVVATSVSGSVSFTGAVSIQ